MGEGIKFDGDKLDWTLLQWEQLEKVVKVLNFGAKKYSPDNWKKVDRERYLKALIRHLVLYLQGEVDDEDSQFPHMSHIVANALIIDWHDDNIFGELELVEDTIDLSKELPQESTLKMLQDHSTEESEDTPKFLTMSPTRYAFERYCDSVDQTKQIDEHKEKLLLNSLHKKGIRSDKV